MCLMPNSYNHMYSWIALTGSTDALMRVIGIIAIQIYHSTVVSDVCLVGDVEADSQNCTDEQVTDVISIAKFRLCLLHLRPP